MNWIKDFTLEEVNAGNKGTSLEHIGFEVTAIEPDKLIGEITVDHRTIQPYGILHGGMNCFLAETLGSIAANLSIDHETHHAVGVSISTHHVKAVRNGKVKGIATAKHIGKTNQLWQIETFNDAGALTSVTELGMQVIKRI